MAIQAVCSLFLARAGSRLHVAELEVVDKFIPGRGAGVTNSSNLLAWSRASLSNAENCLTCVLWAVIPVMKWVSCFIGNKSPSKTAICFRPKGDQVSSRSICRIARCRDCGSPNALPGRNKPHNNAAHGAKPGGPDGSHVDIARHSRTIPTGSAASPTVMPRTVSTRVRLTQTMLGIQQKKARTTA